MSTEINANVLKNFIIKTIGNDKLTKEVAQKYDIRGDKFDEANVDENNYLDLNEIIEDSDLYEQFATMFVDEKEKKNEVDKEKQEEEQNKVQDKSGAGL